MRLLLLLFVACVLATPALSEVENRQFTNNETVSPQPGRAYLLVRTHDFKNKRALFGGTLRASPVLVRLLTGEEMRQADNLHSSDPGHWLEKVPSNVVTMVAYTPYAASGGENTVLVAVEPGTYTLAGIIASTAVLGTGLGMGTVRFEAKPGIITDLGEVLIVYDDAPTDIPELANVVTGKPMELTNHFFFDVAIRPVSAATTVPAGLALLPRIPADYHAMPAFPNYVGDYVGGGQLSRLAPLAGVLDYDKNGDVVDLKLNANTVETKAGPSQTDATQAPTGIQ